MSVMTATETAVAETSARESNRETAERPKIVVVDATNQGHIIWRGSQGKLDIGTTLRTRCEAMQHDWSSEKILCAFDSPDSFRKRIDPSYKAHRAPSPAGLQEQLQAAELTLGNAGFTILSADGFEADDAIASVCCHATRLGYRTIIVSTDKDVRQCLVAGVVTIADKIQMFQGKILPSFVTAAMVRTRYGVGPEQWIDYQCLVGDSTDGIRGADGIGEKTAAQLLSVAGTLDELLANPWKYATKVSVRDSLFEFKSRAAVVKQLVTLRTDVPFVEECFL